MKFFEFRDPPPNRLKHCSDGQECHLTEAAVMVAFALHLLEKDASDVEIHPDGMHGKLFDIKGLLEANGFTLTKGHGTTAYGGTYQRAQQTITVTLIPGIGDVTGKIEGQVLVAECKGGIVNTRHAGQTSRLRRGLCEAVGLLMARPLNGERHLAVVPQTNDTDKLARRILPRAQAAGIGIALIDRDGGVHFV